MMVHLGRSVQLKTLEVALCIASSYQMHELTSESYEKCIRHIAYFRSFTPQCNWKIQMMKSFEIPKVVSETLIVLHRSKQSITYKPISWLLNNHL